MIRLNIQRFALGYIPIKSTPDGTNSTTGKQMETAFNTNFKNVTEAISNLEVAIQYIVTSETVTMLKVDNQGKFYYSIDDPSTPEGQVTWIQINNTTFANIQGSPYDNINLRTVLNSFASEQDLSEVSSTVQGLSTTVGTINQTVSTNTAAISNINNSLPYTVRTDGTQTPLFLKFDAINNIAYISDDNSTWHDLSAMNASWSSISGDASDNASLVSYVTQQINALAASIATDYVDDTTFRGHTNDTSNPHNVTKAQVGLGNVDNTSDLDKPISNAVRAALDNISSSNLQGESLTPTDYQNLSELDPYKVYFTNSLLEQEEGE